MVPRTKKVGDVVVVLRIEHGVVRRRGEEADLEFRLGGGHGRAELVVVRREGGHLLEGRDRGGAALALALVPHVEACANHRQCGRATGGRVGGERAAGNVRRRRHIAR